MSRGTVALIVIVSLSVAAVLVSSGAFVCFVKYVAPFKYSLVLLHESHKTLLLLLMCLCGVSV